MMHRTETGAMNLRVVVQDFGQRGARRKATRAKRAKKKKECPFDQEPGKRWALSLSLFNLPLSLPPLLILPPERLSNTTHAVNYLLQLVTISLTSA